jgi:hypothetical protein
MFSHFGYEYVTATRSLQNMGQQLGEPATRAATSHTEEHRQAQNHRPSIFIENSFAEIATVHRN